MDEKWEPYWHVFLGKSFGCHSVHERNRFVYFTFEPSKISFLIYKASWRTRRTFRLIRTRATGTQMFWWHLTLAFESSHCYSEMRYLHYVKIEGVWLLSSNLSVQSGSTAFQSYLRLAPALTLVPPIIHIKLEPASLNLQLYFLQKLPNQETS